MGAGGAAGHATSANVAGGTYSYSASYDNDLRLTSMSLLNVSLGTTLFSSGRGYDAVGNVTSVNTTLASGTDNQKFCYDDLNRLVWAGATGTPSCGGTVTAGTLTSAQYTATYSYDTLNRITGGALGTLTFGDSAHLHAATSSSTGETASYDASGDMTCRAPTSATTCAGSSPTGALLTYDAERRLTAWQNAPTSPTSQAWFLYDGEGRRVEQYVSGGSGNHTYYLPGNVEEVTPSGSLVKYYSAGGLALGENTASSASGISYLVNDGLGSVSEALNQTGTATGSILYGPYGGVRYTSGTMPTSKGFTGQYADASTGLDYYGARYYDPTLGQFASADTVGGLNRYGYVAGNPETFTDPTGHMIPVDGGSSNSRSGRAPDPRPANWTPFSLAWSDDECYPKGCWNPRGRSDNSDEAKAGKVLKLYFGVHVDRINDNNPLEGEFGYYGNTLHFADYDVYGSHTYLGIPRPLTAETPHYRVDYYKPAAGTRWDNKDGDAQPGGIVSHVIQKGDYQASIVVVDVSDAFDSKPSEEQFEEYGYRAVYAPYSGRRDPSHVARVIYMYKGAVVYDYNPLNYGPPEADHNAVPVIQV